MAKDIPSKKAGVIPSLVHRGLMGVYKEPVSAMGERRLKSCG